MKRTSMKHKKYYISIIRHNVNKYIEHKASLKARGMLHKLIPGIAAFTNGSYYDNVLYATPSYYPLTRT